MSVKSRLDKLWDNGGCVCLSPSSKLVFMSDFHANDGGPTDDLMKNKALLVKTLSYYLNVGYTLILLGDILDLWEQNDIEKIRSIYPELFIIFYKFDALKRLIQIKGNHDGGLDLSEYQILKVGELKLFCIHGYQGDWPNDNGSFVGKFFVRYIWTPLQWVGFEDMQARKRKRHEAQEKKLKEWADDRKVVTICGHTHRLGNHKYYKNSGSWVYMGGNAIEFMDGQFIEKRF